MTGIATKKLFFSGLFTVAVSFFFFFRIRSGRATMGHGLIESVTDWANESATDWAKEAPGKNKTSKMTMLVVIEASFLKDFVMFCSTHFLWVNRFKIKFLGVCKSVAN